VSKLVLYDIFEELRKEKQLVGPGLEEYLEFVQLIKSEYVIRDFEHLSFVLETMWTNSIGGTRKLKELLAERKEQLRDFLKYLDSVHDQQEEQESVIPEFPKSSPDKEASRAGDNSKLTGEKSNSSKGGNLESVGNDEFKSGSTSSETGSLQFSVGGEGASTNLAIGKDKTVVPNAISSFIFSNDYFPIKDRDLQQAWRSLKSVEEQDSNRELDVKATIVKTAEQGMFSNFVFEKRKVNKIRLFVFIDRSESMIAVEAFGKELCVAAGKSQMHSNVYNDNFLRQMTPGSVKMEVKPWYFFNAPVAKKDIGYFLFDEESQNTKSLSALFSGINKRNIVVLIYSDAGALKNDFEQGRIEQTKAFLTELYKRTAYVSWLNPAPRYRWEGTNAGELRKMVPMFESTRGNVESAVSALKGKIQVY
jgi:uncharacterized protein with von Willebrand factor type A (vWA) domain